MFCCTLLYVNSSIAIILKGKRELVVLLNLFSWCLVMVERLFLAVPQGCLQFVIVVFPDHTHLLFLTFRAPNNLIIYLENIIYQFQDLRIYEWGYFCDIYLQKAKVLPGICLSTWKYNVCGQETKILHLHKILVWIIPLFLINKYVIHNLY